MTGHSQLILFLKAPRAGSVKTRLAGALGPEGACAAYRVLVDTLVTQLAGIDGVQLRFAPDDAEAEVAAWRHPSWTTAPQGAGDLGLRLSRAFEDAFARGSQRVAVIGSDCPQIQQADVDAAWLALEEADVVLGPARDGGYWLIGLREPRPELFTDMPWSSERVLEETVARCRSRRLKCQLLRELTDVDELEQWEEFARRTGSGLSERMPSGTDAGAPAGGAPKQGGGKLPFSHELRALAQRFADRPVQPAEILEATQGRGFHLLLVFISLPFLTPIPLPGFSIPFGLAVSVIGARLALGRKPWLPRKLLTYQLPPRFLFKMLSAASRVLRWLEFLLRPRLPWLNEYIVFRRLAGVLISVSGLFLIIPLPLPFSNSLPAATVLLLAAGALERDGLAFLAGCGMFAVSAAYFLLLAFGGMQAFEKLVEAVTGT